MNKPAIILTSPEELLAARLNQPSVSSEEFLRRMEQHKRASEASAKAARSVTSKRGLVEVAVG